jgi:hypothetical protein
MTGIDHSTPTVTHTDVYTNDRNNGTDSELSDVDITYTHDSRQEEYGAVESRGQDIKIEHPVEDVSELQHRAHLTAQFAAANAAPVDDFRITELTESIVAGFDAAIQKYVETALAAEGTSLDELPVPTRHVRAIVLHDAWMLNSWPALEAHLSDTTRVASALGYESVPDQSTFWRASQRLEEAGLRETVGNAATRAVHAAVRHGNQIPESVVRAHGLDFSPSLDEREIAGATRRIAIRNWIRLLLDDVLEPVSFDRADNRSHSVNAIFAAIAQAALNNGMNSAKPVATWYYEADEIPTASQVSRLVRGLDHYEVRPMFTDVTQRFVEIAAEFGFFQEEYDYALDTTWLDRDGEGELVIKNPKATETGQGWQFAALCVMNNEARFALGIDLVTDNSETTEHFRYLLRTAAKHGDVGRIHIDREFYDGDAVRACRVIAGRNWAIRGKRKGEVKELLNETPEGEIGFRENIDFSDVTPSVNVYVHPVPPWLRNENNDTHMAFITDLSPTEIELLSIFDRYQKRWTIETFFRQVKHGFGAPTSTPDPTLQWFLLNVGMLYYNFHTLINRAPSPQYGLRLNVTFYEVLLGVVDVVFQRKPSTEP